MNSFQYVTATSPESAHELLAKNGRYLGGGIDLLGEMKDYITEPSVVVNVKDLPGLDKIQSGDKVWTFGTNVTVAQLEDHPELKKVFPGLQMAAAEVGSRQIRNVATLGGNLAQHSRCWYYRHRDVKCLKRGGNTCYARDGENKYHSLFTGNPCISPVVSNLAISLGTLEAVVIVERGGKTLRLSISELYQKAWENPTAHNSLEPGDLITKIEIPVQQRRSAYLQMSEKSMFDWALVSCAASAKFDGSKVSQARIFLGQVANVPFMVQEANESLEGASLDENSANKAADLLLEKAQPHSQNGYKVQIAKTLVRRTLLQLKA